MMEQRGEKAPGMSFGTWAALPLGLSILRAAHLSPVAHHVGPCPSLQVLEDRGEMGSRHGRAIFSVLLLQVRLGSVGVVIADSLRL